MKTVLKLSAGFIVLLVIISFFLDGSATPMSAPSQSPGQPQPAKPAGASAFGISVEGDPGIPFSGSYLVFQADGSSVSKSVEGKTPARYNATGSIVSVFFQKSQEAGRLRVRILKDGLVVSDAETTAAYGVVSIASP